MNSSITVDANLRKKIKKLAAELDTTQGDIVAQAIFDFEANLGKTFKKQNDIARNIMKSATFDNPKLKWRLNIREKCSRPGIDIEELEIRSWGDMGED
ncbi:MAG: hypothetical protein ACTSYI_07830 [Promethearchaeota archaeon]